MQHSDTSGEFKRWNERFSANHYIFGTEPNVFLKAQKDRLEPGWKALAVADGEGRNGVWLAEQGLDVTSVDFAPEGQAKAKKLAESRGAKLEFKQADIINWDWPVAEYDLIAVIFIQFAEPADRTRIFEGLKQALKPGGLLLLEGYRPEQIEFGTGGPKARENMYTEELLRDAFGELEIVSLEAYDAEVDEGPGHRGKSALIDLIAQKPAG
jgi:SAM-dependent methyltransferase